MKHPALCYPKITLPLFVTFFLVACFGLQLGYINWDASWLLSCGNALLHGGNYGTTFIETNPPLIIWLTLPVVIVAHYLPGGVAFWFAVYCFLFVLISLYLSFHATYLLWPKQLYLDVCLLALAWGFFLLSPLIVGEREFFSIVMTAPYFLLRAVVANKLRIPVWLRMSILVFAISGFLLKPYFLLPLMLVEILLAVWQKKWWHVFNLETVTIFLAGLVYLGLIELISPQFYRLIMPLNVFIYLPAWQASVWQMLRFNDTFIWMVIFLLGLWCLQTMRDKRTLSILLAAQMGYLFGSYFMQQKSWYYHIYPTVVISVLILSLLIADRFLLLQRLHFRWGLHLRPTLEFLSAGFLFIACVLGLTFHSLYANIWASTSPKSLYIQAMHLPEKAQYTEGPILVLDENIGVNQAIFRDHPGLWSVLKTPSFFLVPSVMALIAKPGRKGPRQRAWMAYSLNLFAASIQQHPPGMIVARERETYLARLLKMPQFSGLLRDFDAGQKIGYFWVYLRLPKKKSHAP